MNVSAYYPVFFVEDLEAEANRYTRDLGFTIRHRREVRGLRYFILENNGNRIDLVNTTDPILPFSSGFYGMRVNVDQFDEGLGYFLNRGYKKEGETIEDESSMVAVLIGRDGMRIVLFHHKRNNDAFF